MKREEANVFRLEHVDGDRARPRVVTEQRLGAADFSEVARVLGAAPFRARKISFVSARQAAQPERVETRYDGKESENRAEPGDWIVTNMDADRNILRDGDGAVNTYVIRATEFLRLYDRDQGSTEHGEIYKAKGVVDALEFSGGFSIVPPWGGCQQAASGFLVRNGADVYGIHKDAFEKTYERVP